MLTLANTWTQAFRRSGVRPVMVVGITIGATTYKAQSGHSSILTYPQSVASVTPVSSEKDPWTCESQIGECEVLFAADGWAKELLVGNRLRGKKVAITLGAAGLSESDYAPYFCGVIDKALPIAGNGVRMTVIDALAYLRDAEITGNWFNLHPLEAMLDIIERAGVPAELIDDASFDPALYSEISHFVVSRGELRSGYGSIEEFVGKPVKALTLLNELAQLLDGAVLVGEDGGIRYQHFDPDDDEVATWTDDDIGDLEVQELDGNAINSIIVNIGDGKAAKASFRRDQRNSKAAFAYPGETQRRFTASINAPWCDGVASLVANDMTALRPRRGSTFFLGGEMVCAMSGTRGATPGPQAADAKVNTSRLAYLVLSSDLGSEIVSASKCEVVNSEVIEAFVTSDTFPATNELVAVGPFPCKAKYTVYNRGELGTAPMAHIASVPAGNGVSEQATEFDRARVHDITIAVAMAERRLERWAYGVPIVEFPTGLDKHAVQIGDLVVLETDQFFCYGHDDISDGAILWEVISKEVDPDEGRITWRLAFAAGDVLTTQSYHHRIDVANTTGNSTQEDIASQNRFSNNFVLSGFAATAAGLLVTIGRGKATSGTNVVKWRGEERTYTLTNGTTTWFYIDVSNGALVKKTGATEPTRTVSQLPLWQAVASGGVVTLTDRRVDKGVNGTQLAEGTVGGTQIAEAAVDVEHIATGAVTEPKIETGAVIGAKIANEAVTYDKLAADAVGSQKVRVESIGQQPIAPGGAKKTPNSTFTQWKTP